MAGELQECLGINGTETALTPVIMEETAAQVHTTTVLPSLNPSVCSMKPADDRTMLAARPAGAASHVVRAAKRNPVLHAAADSPKQAPACDRHRSHWSSSQQAQ